MNGRNTYKLGIDVGGSKIRADLLDNRNKPRFVFNVATPQNKKTFLKVLESEIGKIVESEKIFGIGVGLPGIVDAKRGILIKAPNLPFLKNWQAKKFFSKFSKNIKIDNDGNCFLRGEAILGFSGKYKNIVALTIGTGIGGAIMIEGGIYYGKRYSAGEFGHMVIDDLKTLEQLGAKQAFLRAGDRSKIIGIGVANLINAFDPEIVILGGGGITSGRVKIETVRKTARRYIMSPLSKKTKIIKGKLSDDAQAIGAALLLKS